MINAICALLAHSWSGLVIAALVAGLGWLIVRAARWRGYPRLRGARFVGYAIYALAVLLAVGSVVAIIRIRQAEAGHPPMGKLVDVGGYRMHILAEGEAQGGPTLVWIPGGHAPGLALYHLHKAMRNETRSILFDRPGTGWSDTGPFPRRTAREAEELRTLLDNAGERGPFILIGYSYGGLLAANYARRYPEKTAAVVLLDATPPDVFVYLLNGGGENLWAGLVRSRQRAAFLKLFGVWSDPVNDKSLAEVSGALSARSAAPASNFAAASIIGEWGDPRSVAELLVYDGELGDLPVFVVVPADNDPKDVERQLGLGGEDLRRALNFLQRARLRYLSASSKSELIHTPAGTTHLFGYEAPDFVVDTVRRVLARSRQGTAVPRNHENAAHDGP